MRRRSVRLAAGVLVGTMLFAGCGGKGGSEAGDGTRNCDGIPLSSTAIRLPGDFPIPSAAALTTSSKAGPSQVVEGYWEGDLESAYRGWTDAFEGAGFAILFDEIEEQDSEISYLSPDQSSTGQVALRSECRQGDRTFVHITNRPA